MIRELQTQDLDKLLRLYTFLHNNPIPERAPAIDTLWQEILEDPRHHIIGAWQDGQLVSSCVCVVVPNLTHGQRPYALIENVVTDPAHRRHGFATACLEAACRIAQSVNCYKVMLLTGSKQESTLRFYENAGFNRHDKTAFIRWL